MLTCRIYEVSLSCFAFAVCSPIAVGEDLALYTQANKLWREVCFVIWKKLETYQWAVKKPNYDMPKPTHISQFAATKQ